MTDVYSQIIDGYSAIRSANYDKQSSSIREVIDDWANIYLQDKKRLCERYKDVIEICLKVSGMQKQMMVQHKRDGHLFNVFSLWHRLMGISEPIHSRILHFLLSEDQLHGQGDIFLQLLLEMLDIETPKEGEWHASAELDRVDVRLVRQNPQSVVIIENKSNWAEDQPNQLYRYWYSNIHSTAEDCFPDHYIGNDRYKIVYLVPKDIKQLSEQSLLKPSRDWFKELSDKEYESLPQRIPITPVVWTFDKHIDQWLEKCEESLEVENTPLRNFIRQYRTYCKQL